MCHCGKRCVNFQRIKVEKSIAQKLGIFKYRSYKAIPAAKKAWITIKAKQQGKDSKMVHAGIKAEFTKRGK